MYPMNDFGNTGKWTEFITGNAEFVERNMNTVKIRVNEANAVGCLATVNPVDAVAEGILDVEIFADRQAAVTGLSISQVQGETAGYNLRLVRDVAYGVICWRQGSADFIMADTEPPEKMVSLRMVINAATRTVTYYYNGSQIYTGSISSVFNLNALYIGIYASATRGDRTVLGTTTFTSYYTPPPQYTLTIQATTGGTTSPAVGTYTYDEGASVQVTAIANTGYKFDHWELDGVNVGSVNPITITMDKDHTLLAVFSEIPPTPPTVEVINPCTELSYAFQGRTGSWMNNGKAPYAEAVIVSDGDLLPDGKTVKSYLSGKCTRLMSGFTDSERQCCNFYAGWLNPAANWDLRGLELLKVRLLTNYPNASIVVYVTADGWTKIGEVRLSPGEFPIDSWFEVAVDLRAMGASPELLSKVKAICLYVAPIGNQYNTYVLTEYWTVEPATGPVPLGCSITPTTAVIKINEVTGFTATAWGGTPPYTVEWILNGAVVRTDTISASGGSVVYNFSSAIVGSYQLFARVTDSSSPPQTKDTEVASIVVKAPLPPREPCRPLHVEGNLIKDDMGRIVHLHGVNWHGFEDHPYGHLVDINGQIHYGTWNIDIIRDMLNGLVEWGVNCIRCHSSAVIWKGNYGNIQSNFQTLLTECLQRGIYVILDFYDVGYYNMGAAQDPVPWRPTNPDFGPVTDVTGYSTVTWKRLADVFPDIASFVEFWRMIANLLKNYPNVIFEFWNEPHVAPGLTREEAMSEFFSFVQQAVNAVRETGANQLILVQWGYGVAYYPWQPGTYSIIPWVNEYFSKLSDPAGNLVVSTHCYRVYDGFGRWPDGHRGYTVQELTEAFTDEFLPVAETYPLIIGEIGANLGASDYNNEITAFRNAFDILGQKGVHYTAFWWFPQGPRALLSGQPNYAPTDAGLQLIEAIQSLTPITPGKGVLECHAYIDTQEIAASVEIVGVGTYTTPFSIELDAGNYILNATYEKQMQTKTATITEGTTTRIDFKFTAPAPPTPPKPIGILAAWGFPICSRLPNLPPCPIILNWAKRMGYIKEGA
jgi:hypothetical protein